MAALAGASAPVAAESGAVLVLTVLGFLTLVAPPRRLTFGRVSLVGLLCGVGWQHTATAEHE
jgi:hypothetical protein